MVKLNKDIRQLDDESFVFWKSDRKTIGDIELSYEVELQPKFSKNGPPYGLFSAGNGVSGMGSAFLLLPYGSCSQKTIITWELDGLSQKMRGVITSGEGNLNLDISPSELRNQWFLCGDVQKYQPFKGSEFSGYWLGHPYFDPRIELEFAAKCYDVLDKHFGFLKPRPEYRMFIAVREFPPYGGGAASDGAFLISLNKNGFYPDIRSTFFHEMAHQWVGDYRTMGMPSEWFEEGFTDYCTLTLMLKYGLVDTEYFLEELNNMSERYYSTKAKNMTLWEIEEAGFDDEEIRHSPYDRGAMYFISLNARIFKMTNGKQNLDSIIIPLLLKRQRGESMPDWRDVLQQNFGIDEVIRFEQEVVFANRKIQILSDTFGSNIECIEEEANFDQNDNVINRYRWQTIRLD